jgi:hypothetical protein
MDYAFSCVYQQSIYGRESAATKAGRRAPQLRNQKICWYKGGARGKCVSFELTQGGLVAAPSVVPTRVWAANTVSMNLGAVEWSDAVQGPHDLSASAGAL